MAKREWGVKHTCMGCGVKFYDLHRRPIACPKCGTEVEVEIVRPIRRRLSAQPEPSPSANTDPVIEAAVDKTANDDADDVIDAIDDDDDDLVDGIEGKDLVDGIDDKKAIQPEP